MSMDKEYAGGYGLGNTPDPTPTTRFASAEEAATHWRTVAQQLTEELAESKQSFEEFKSNLAVIALQF